MEVAFDVTKADPSVFSKMSMEQLAEEGTGQEAKPPGEVKPSTAEQGSTSAPPGAAEGETKAQEGSTAEEKKDVQGAPSGAEPAKEPEKADDKEHNFSVLRAKAQRLEQERNEAQRQAEEFARKLQEQQNANIPTVTELASVDKRIEELRQKAKDVGEEAPGIAADYIAAADDLLRVRNTLVLSERERQQLVEREQKKAEGEAKDQTQAGIDGNAVLKHWQSQDVESFNRAADFDAMLKKSPAWKDKPLAERFAKVVELVKTENPNVSLPTPEAPPQGEKKQETQQAAAAEVKPSAPIRSLTDVPGGLPPAKNLNESVAETSPSVLHNQFSKKSRAEQDAWLFAEQ